MRNRILPTLALLACCLIPLLAAPAAWAQATTPKRAPKVGAKPSGRATRKTVPAVIVSLDGATMVLKPADGTPAITATLAPKVA